MYNLPQNISEFQLNYLSSFSFSRITTYKSYKINLHTCELAFNRILKSLNFHLIEISFLLKYIQHKHLIMSFKSNQSQLFWWILNDFNYGIHVQIHILPYFYFRVNEILVKFFFDNVIHQFSCRITMSLRRKMYRLDNSINNLINMDISRRQLKI